MTSGGRYLEGATIRLSATFSVAGVLTDPTTVTLKIKSPAGVTTSYTYALGGVTKSVVGSYYKDYLPSATGTYWYRWIGDGAAAGVEETSFRIASSRID